MGITGLLPALKSIQTTRHLKDYAGQTVAVDAYVWLHKGVYACAVDLAMGKSTTKYVEYAMHRVRMLRHFGVEPYIVFDGGPLPAKKGTESERRKMREENKARGKALVAQGKHSLARDCFVKCVDVTPQMAYQFIKALKAEGVSYIVAPYEADAQLAYLERIGIVDAILTEDSDLLVFGCQNVLFKLDTTANTVVSISRKDFGRVTTPHSDISLIGWSDVQFRAMAILSGCDYLPSIPGIGLKTACNLLRKWKTVEQVIKALMLEGKKAVPSDYAKNFQLAEKCFLHQRVYCPLEEKLVHVTPVGGDWTDEFDEYCGIELAPDVAKKLATGQVDPVHLLPMVDINTGYKPKSLSKAPAVAPRPVDKKGKGKEVAAKPKPNGGIHNFFGPNPTIPPRVKVSPLPAAAPAGRASGKRTLVEIAEQDAASRKKHKPRQSTPALLPTAKSKFFKTQDTTRRHSLDSSSLAGPSRLADPGEKENETPECWEEDDEADRSDLSICAQKQTDSEYTELEVPPEVEQEDGYMSPMTPTTPEQNVQELSSPSRGQDDDLGDPVSSPSSACKRWNSYKRPPALSSSQSNSNGATREPSYVDEDDIATPGTVKKNSAGRGEVLVEGTPTPAGRFFTSHVHTTVTTVDLASIFIGPEFGESVVGGGDHDVLEQDAGLDSPDGDSSATPPSASPDTPGSSRDEVAGAPPEVIDVDEFELYDPQELAARAAAERQEVVARGWKERFSYGSKASPRTGEVSGKAKSGGISKAKKVSLSPAHLRRSNTNVTPMGRHSLQKQPRLSFPLPGSTLRNRTDIRKATPSSSTKGKAASSKAFVFQSKTTIVVSDEEDEITTLSSPPPHARTPFAASGSANGAANLLDRFKYR